MAPGDSRGSGGGGGGLRKMMLGGMLLTLSLLLLSFYPVSGERDNPSYKECQPHIDATIRNLAAKAIVAGETPSEDIKPEDYDIEEVEEEEVEVPPQPIEPEVPDEEEEEEEEKEPEHEPEVEEEEEEEEEVEPVHEPEEEEEEEEEPEAPAEPEEPEEEEEEEEPVEEPVKPEPVKQVEPEKPKKEKKEKEQKAAKEEKEKELKKTQEKKKEEKKKVEVVKEEKKEVKKRQEEKKKKEEEKKKKVEEEEDEEEDEEEEEVAKIEKEKEEPPKKATPKKEAPKAPKKAAVEDIGIINKIINAIFGLPTTERDPKYAEPWQTHPEFKKEPVKEAPAVPKKVDTSGGIIHKFVSLIFGEPKGKRDPKWAQPWQTHEEHKKDKKDEIPAAEEEKVIYGAMGGPIDKLVRLIFPVKEYKKRDPKWAQPWQTHEEFAHKKEDEKKGKKKKEEEKVVVHEAMGGPIDKLVRLIFPVQETKERDPKWAQPWQTHKEFAHKKEDEKKPKKEEEEKVIYGAMGGPIDKLVRLIFPVKEYKKRDPKWAQPWQTHEEFAHKKVDEKKDKPKKEEKVVHGDLGGPIDMLVRLIFPVQDVKKKRDPKWAQPWQTHEEFAHKKEDEKLKKVEEKVIHADMGGPLDKLVKIVFDTVKEGTPRDPKWAEPWQTHPEHRKAEPAPTEKPKPAPKPAPKAEPTPKPAPKAEPAPAPKAKPAKPAPKEEPKPAAKPAPTPKPAPKEEPKPAKPAPAPKPAPKEEPKPAKPAPAPKPAAKEPAPKPKPAEAPKAKPEEPKPTFPGKGPAEAPAAAPPSRTPPTDGAKAARKPVLEQEAPTAPPPPPPVPKEEEEQIVVVPSTIRSRDRLEAILGLDEVSKNVATRVSPIADVTLTDLKKIYESTIVPLETLYKYQDISNRHVSDAELFGTPLVLLMGPYSTGKSSFINYLLGIEYTKRALKTGAPPSHGVFRVVQHGQRDAELDGTALISHKSFTSLQKFGQNFVDQLHGRALNVPLLKKVTFVEAPGILEMRRPGERLYPFNDALQWFIDRADLILVMFDYTKLDAGYEMEAVLDQLKGREAQTRILLNKADQIPAEELIKVQGSLFWNLSPLLGVSSPPTVYAGSFTSQPYRSGSPAKLFQAQEEALLTDLANAIDARVENRIAIARRHAVRVRNHAQMVDTYLTTFFRNKGFLTSKHKLAEDIIENPHTYNIYEGMSLLTNISRYDLPDPEVYRDFFRVHNLYDFQTLKATCSYFRGCPLTKIDEAISTDLPKLLERYRRLVEAALATPAAKAGRAAPVPAPPVRGNVAPGATARTS